MDPNIERVINEYSDMVYRIALTRTKTVENAEDMLYILCIMRVIK
jgi:hypothetical protein